MYSSRFLGRLLSVALFASVAAFPAVIYQVTVSLPGTVQGTNGIVDMQFSEGDPSTPEATAVVSAVTGGIVFGAVEPPIGSVTGSLQTSVIFPTNAGNNDFAQNVTFGSSFGFLLSLDGPAITAPTNGPAGTRFSLLLYQSDFVTPVLPTDLVGTVDINPDGSIVTDGISGADYSVTFDLVDVPEPATWLLSAGVLLVLCLARKRQASVRG
jgi:hypothetical protein